MIGTIQHHSYLFLFAALSESFARDFLGFAVHFWSANTDRAAVKQLSMC